jgi:hypothetical protein
VRFDAEVIEALQSQRQKLTNSYEWCFEGLVKDAFGGLNHALLRCRTKPYFL